MSLEQFSFKGRIQTHFITLSFTSIMSDLGIFLFKKSKKPINESKDQQTLPQQSLVQECPTILNLVDRSEQIAQCCMTADQVIELASMLSSFHQQKHSKSKEEQCILKKMDEKTCRNRSRSRRIRTKLEYNAFIASHQRTSNGKNGAMSKSTTKSTAHPTASSTVRPIASTDVHSTTSSTVHATALKAVPSVTSTNSLLQSVTASSALQTKLFQPTATRIPQQAKSLDKLKAMLFKHNQQQQKQ